MYLYMRIYLFYAYGFYGFIRMFQLYLYHNVLFYNLFFQNPFAFWLTDTGYPYESVKSVCALATYKM